MLKFWFYALFQSFKVTLKLYLTKSFKRQIVLQKVRVKEFDRHWAVAADGDK